MSLFGQEGDTRKFRRLRHDDYYESKTAVEAEKRQPRKFKRCKTCGDILDCSRTECNGYCHRCYFE